MKKLFTIYDLAVAFIAALGYGFGFEIPKLMGYSIWLNRRKSLPTRGVITVIRIGNRTGNKLNLRNIPSTARAAKVITEMTTGDEFTALERFAEEERDWYRIRTDDYEEGWVSGRYIELR